MANFRSLDDIILAMLDFMRVVQPDLDTKPGSVARDILDAPASEISKLYIELRNIQNLQSIASARGRNLDLLARNFGLARGGGSPATGTIVFTTNVLDSDIFISEGTIVSARSGIGFKTLSDITIEASKANVYRSNAIRLNSDLELAGITDQYAIEVAVEATTFGTAGNVAKFSIINHAIPSISNVTNTQSFTGGTNAESDDAFRARVLGVFAGSNTGTSLGYINAILANPAVVNVLAVEPGDPLMIRDGTDTATNDSGETIIITSGTGGKVDLYIQGTNLQEFTESYIYRDQSGKNDPTDPANDFVLGQREVNPLLDFQQRRRLLLEAGTLPFQPVEDVLTVNGSLSGPNFIEKFTDDEGQERGSFELVKDDGAFAGSPFGFDRIRFISNKVELTDESISKGTFNGEDALDFSDVQEIIRARQNVSISNEQPTVNPTDRSILTLKHTPFSVVNSVVNVTTGQRYRINNQNVDGTAGGLNTTGRIQVAGGTLPTTNDVLQVNYLWDSRYDNLIDYDNLQSPSAIRTTQDSVDWGFSNKVLAEEETVVYSAADGYHVIVTHPISRLVNVNTVTQEASTNVSGKIIVADTIVSLVSVKDTDGKEVFFTAESNGSFSGKEITLPTDALISSGETVNVTYNPVDIFEADGYDSGTFAGNVINLQTGVANVGTTVFVDYVANINTLIPTTTLAQLPATGSENEFVINNNFVGNQPVSNIYSSGSIVRNLRFAPSYLQMDLQGILATGRLTIRGTSYTKVEQIITIRRDGLLIDLGDAIKQQLGVGTLPSTGYLARVDSIEKVTLSNNQISSVDLEYDVLNYELKNIQYSDGTAFADTTLSNTEVQLAQTTANTANSPSTGDTVRVVAYWADSNAVERVVVSASGVQFSAKKYAFVDTVSVDSGFVGLGGTIEGTINITNFNQPISGANYFLSYDYLAPKEGERITITYNYNRLISDSTFDIEEVRPVTADVLVKAATPLVVDVSMNIVAIPGFSGGEQNLRQSVAEAVTVFIASNGLGSTIDNDDIIVAAHSVAGVDRVTLTNFNLEGETGIKQSIIAGRNQFFAAGIINVTIEER